MSTKNYNYRKIEIDSTSYQEELKLRDEILRKPIGLSIYDDALIEELNDHHLGCFDHNALVGILLLKVMDNQTVKMRQVAIASLYQGQGLGAKLVSFGELYAKKLGYKKITLHGRKHVEDFYRKLGYLTVGDDFIEVGMPQVEMIKDLEVL